MTPKGIRENAYSKFPFNLNVLVFAISSSRCKTELSCAKRHLKRATIFKPLFAFLVLTSSGTGKTHEAVNG